VNNGWQTGKSKYWLLALLWPVLLVAGCSGGGAPGGTSGGVSGGGGNTGTLVLFAEDQAADNVLAFEMTISSVTATDSTGTVVPLLSAPVDLEWRSRGLAPTVLSVTSLAPATYIQLTVTVATPEMTVFNPLTGVSSETNPPLLVSTVNLPVTLVISSGDVVGVRLDLDLRNSVQLDISSNFFIDPTFAAVPTSFIVGQLPGDADDVLASVSSVNTTDSQLGASVLASGQALTVDTDSTTLFDGVAGLSSLQAGDIIALDARLQSSGNFLAQEIKREVAGTTQQLRGLVLDRTPTTGDLTSLTLLVLEAAPTGGGFVAGDQVTVTVDASTGFRIAQEDLPTAIFPNLDFDRQTLQPGQFIHVVQRTGAGFIADDITLEEITLVGRVGLAVGANSFDLVPEGDFFAQNNLGQVSVVTSSTQTELEDMSAGLGSLQPNLSIVAVRGVLVFQGGSGVLVAKRVRLLQ
jgi:hypothetical protein